jgi:hypothetical protein
METSPFYNNPVHSTATRRRGNAQSCLVWSPKLWLYNKISNKVSTYLMTSTGWLAASSCRLEAWFGQCAQAQRQPKPRLPNL